MPTYRFFNTKTDKEWEELMWTFQQALPNSKDGSKWVLMDKIYDLNTQAV